MYWSNRHVMPNNCTYLVLLVLITSNNTMIFKVILLLVITRGQIHNVVVIFENYLFFGLSGITFEKFNIFSKVIQFMEGLIELFHITNEKSVLKNNDGRTFF